MHYLQECIDFDRKIKDKLNQCQDDFESFINNFELNIDSVTEVIFFNCCFWWFNNNNNNTGAHEGSKIYGVTSQFGLQQIIKGPTCIIGDSLSSIDMIFTI